MDSSRSTSTQPLLPVCVEAVVSFGYPRDLVMATYRQLTARSSNPAAPTRRAGTAASTQSSAVTAAALMLSVDTALGRERAQGSDGSHSHRPGSSVSFGDWRESGGGMRSDLEGDGPGEEPEASTSSTALSTSSTALSSTSSTALSTSSTALSPTSSAALSPASGGNAAHRHVMAGNTDTPGEVEAATPRLPSSTTAGSSPASFATTNSDAVTGNLTETGSSSDAPSQSESNTLAAHAPQQASVSHTSPSELRDSASPHQLPQPQRSAPATSDPPAPPSDNVTERESTPAADNYPERESTPAADRDRERQRQLARLLALRKENQLLKARQLCHQCRQCPADLTFLPCGHFLFCQSCGSRFQTCPACRKTILADVRTFLS